MKVRFVRKSGLPQAEISVEDLALYDAAKGKYFGLEGSSIHIWQLLESPMSIRGLCERLLVEFDVAPDVCRQQVQEFVAQLIKEGLVSQVDETSEIETP